MMTTPTDTNNAQSDPANAPKKRLQTLLDAAEFDTLTRRARRYGFRNAGALARALCRLIIHATDYHDTRADDADDNATIMDIFAAYSDHLAADYDNKPVRHNNSQKYY